MTENGLPPFLKNETCAVTGHRILSADFDENELYRTLKGISEQGFRCFLVGMAIGFDTACFRALLKVKKEDPAVKIAAVIPCVGQDAFFREKDRETYRSLIGLADYKAVLEDEYREGCMLKRNDFLLANSSLLLAYLRTKRGGTWYTVRKAQSLGIPVRYFPEDLVGHAGQE